MWIDSHCHVTADAFAADRAEVLARAVAAGVERMIAIGAGYGVAHNAAAVALANPDQSDFFLLGQAVNSGHIVHFRIAEIKALDIRQVENIGNNLFDVAAGMHPARPARVPELRARAENMQGWQACAAIPTPSPSCDVLNRAR